MDEQFTIEDVREWLGCSREAGKRVWEDSNFYVAMYRKATVNYSGLLKTGHSKHKNKLEETGFDVMQVSAFLVWALQARIKEKQVNGTKNYIHDFSDLPRFISYVKKCAAGDLASSVIKHLKVVVPESENWERIEKYTLDGSGGQGDYSCSENRRLSVLPTQHEATSHQELLEEKFCDEAAILEQNPGSVQVLQLCVEKADLLFDAFEDWIGASGSPALQRFLALMSGCANHLGGGKMAVLGMIAKRHDHIAFLTKAREQMGDAFNQNTYNSNILRIETKWRAFLETEEGRKKYADFLERYEECYH
ncbi:MAG TPA: hypothetical protein PKN70_11245 [Smithellaceae bacterium]|nr:hypothetical protein [Smithellaceae bacterium]HQP25583.1 hypothetical protein [Smithellaceae bacterium]